jgi:hypothetical protein
MKALHEAYVGDVKGVEELFSLGILSQNEATASLTKFKAAFEGYKKQLISDITLPDVISSEFIGDGTDEDENLEVISEDTDEEVLCLSCSVTESDVTNQKTNKRKDPMAGGHPIQKKPREGKDNSSSDES